MGHTKKIFFLKTDLQLLIETEQDRKLDKSAKKYSQTVSLFCVLGSAQMKATCKMLVKLTPVGE
jgi:hypothetical protein